MKVEIDHQSVIMSEVFIWVQLADIDEQFDILYQKLKIVSLKRNFVKLSN